MVFFKFDNFIIYGIINPAPYGDVGGGNKPK